MLMNRSIRILTITIALGGLALLAPREAFAQGVPNDQEIVDKAPS